MKKQLTEIRLSVEHAQQAVEYWANGYLFKQPVEVVTVEFIAKDGQFKVSLTEGETE